LAPSREFNKKYTLVKKDSLRQAGLVSSREEIRRGGLAKQERRRGAKKKSLCGSAPLRELNKK